MAEQNDIGNDEPWNRDRRRMIEMPTATQRNRMKMTISTRPTAFFADSKVLRALRWAFVAGILAAGAAPDLAAAQAARMARSGVYDGTWNVTFTPREGNCHASNTIPFSVAGTRVSSAGGGKVTGGVTRGGGVSVTIQVGASVASGTGRLGSNSGAGRWSGIITGDRCSGVWQAARG
jgi:hypothetical protein